MKRFEKLKKTAKRAGISWVTVWMIVAALILTGLVGYASYTGVTMVKRVISTKAGAGLLFSSNYMTTGTLTSIEYGNYSDYLDGEGNPLSTNPTYTMNVCNYSQGDKATWYTSSNISYTVTAELLMNERYTSEEAEALEDASLEGQYKKPSATDIGTKQFGIKYSSDASYQYFSSDNLKINLPPTGTYTLNKNAATADDFIILIDKSELQSNAPNFWIKLTATPTSVAGGEVEAIDGYLGLCKNASGDANWTGMIGDESYTSKDYDAYNYIISGNGSGTFYFAWDDDKVKPNEFALLNYGSGSTPLATATMSDWSGFNRYPSGPVAVTGSDNWKYLTLTVDSSDLPRYEIQLYKTSGSDYSSVIAGYVDYKFVADE